MRSTARINLILFIFILLSSGIFAVEITSYDPTLDIPEGTPEKQRQELFEQQIAQRLNNIDAKIASIQSTTSSKEDLEKARQNIQRQVSYNMQFEILASTIATISIVGLVVGLYFLLKSQRRI